MLSKEDLNNVIRDYPEAQQLLKKKARRMLQKDEKKDESAKDKAEELKDKCRVSADIRVPRMLQAVRQLLPKHSPAKQELDRGEQQREFPRLLLSTQCCPGIFLQFMVQAGSHRKSA